MAGRSGCFVLLQGLVLFGLLRAAPGIRLQQAHDNSELSHQEPFRQALGRLTQENAEDKLCITVPGPFVGRLSNTVAMVNVVLRAAVESGARFHFPSQYTRWMQQEGLEGLFGGGGETCEEHDVQVYDAICPPGGKKVPASKGRCSIYELLLDATARRANRTTQLCGCRRAVVVDGSTLFWDHDYQLTHSLLSARYWQSHAQPLLLASGAGPAAARPRRQVVVHVRLGDVENETACLKRFTIYNCRKKLQADLYVKMAKALFRVLPPSCVDVSLVTDGRSDSPDILSIRSGLADAGASAPAVWTAKTLSTAKTFDLMTHADVLVYGSSGFGQLAGILARPWSARVGAPMPRGYVPDPLSFLANTTQLHQPRGYFQNKTTEVLDEREAVKALSQNGAIQAFAEQCRAHA